MKRSGTILDEFGRVVRAPEPQEDNLAAAQALIETRLNAAIVDLRQANDRDLRELAARGVRKWHYVSLSSWLVTIVIGWITWVYGPQQVEGWVRQFVEQKM